MTVWAIELAIDNPCAGVLTAAPIMGMDTLLIDSHQTMDRSNRQAQVQNLVTQVGARVVGAAVAVAIKILSPPKRWTRMPLLTRTI